jgi:hypothetical protein
MNVLHQRISGNNQYEALVEGPAVAGASKSLT